MSACLKVTTPVGSSFLASAVDRALTPKPWMRVSEGSRRDLHSTYQRRITHAQYYHTLVFRAVFAPSSDVRLEHIASIQERHLAVRLDPHLVPCMRRDHCQGGDVQAELSGFGELPKAGAE